MLHGSKQMVTLVTVVTAMVVGLTSCASAPSGKPKQQEQSANQDPIEENRTRVGTSALALVAAARAQVGVTTGYDAGYFRLAYPGGDVPLSTGVCSDVVVRALRAMKIDLQQRIHEDMRANFSEYPQKWGLKKPDANIDHRRVPNLVTYCSRRGYSLPVTTNPSDYLPGDIVAMGVPGVQGHIGIVSDQSTNGRPLFIHNVGAGTKEEDVLFAWTITGHYRIVR
jgi:uncharacterized protein